MDNAHKSNRMFPGYGIAALKSTVAEGVTEWNNAENIEKMKKEIAARECGASVAFKTPQVSWK